MDLRNDKGLQVKAGEFTRFLSDLHFRMGAMRPTFQDVIDFEVARVLEKALEKTEAADRAKIRARVKSRAKFEVHGTAYWTSFRGKPQRVPNAVWAEIGAKRARSLARKLAKVGLTKQSFLLLARLLRQDINAPAYVRQARAEFQSAAVQGNVSIVRSGGGNKYGLRINNQIPTLDVPGTQGRRAFFAALQGRIGFYRMNVAKGVFDSVESIAKKYRVKVRNPLPLAG